MAEKRRPVSYQQTLGGVSETIQKVNKKEEEKNEFNRENNLKKIDANFPE